MRLLEKIYNSRVTLKDILSNEWNTETIHDVSLQELEAMYVNENTHTYIDSGCNLTLTHKHLPSHKLHIIYYNFPVKIYIYLELKLINRVVKVDSLV